MEYGEMQHNDRFGIKSTVRRNANLPTGLHI